MRLFSFGPGDLKPCLLKINIQFPLIFVSHLSHYKSDLCHRRIACLTLGLSRGMNGVTQREWSFLLLLWGLSDPRIAELREMPQSFIIKLYSETQVSGRLGMSGGISPRHAQNPLSGERRKTLSITHHALSPPPSHHHLYIIHLINWLQRFYRIIMSLKRPFVPKSDVKQWFTTTCHRRSDKNHLKSYHSHYKSDLDHWKSDHNNFKSYLSHYKTDLGH